MTDTDDSPAAIAESTIVARSRENMIVQIAFKLGKEFYLYKIGGGE